MKRIGVVLGRREATPLEFWVGVEGDGLLRLDDLVVVEGGERRALHYDTCESCGGIWIEGPEEEEIPESVDWKTAVAEIVDFYRAFRKK